MTNVNPDVAAFTAENLKAAQAVINYEHRLKFNTACIGLAIDQLDKIDEYTFDFPIQLREVRDRLKRLAPTLVARS